MGQTLTFRTTQAVVAQLEQRARHVRLPKTVLAEQYVKEGLAMDAFPGVVFRDGPAGRRAALAGGPDVWEVIEVFSAAGGDPAATADHLSLRTGLVDAAVRYYAANRQEIDGWIAVNREMMAGAKQLAANPVA
ncbi:MAG: ribbon-helix-helix protein, CopG family [Candidatus Dormibacteria bacterium]